MPTVQTIISGTADGPITAGTAEYIGLMGSGYTVWSSEIYVGELISAPGKLTNFKVGIAVAPGAGNSWVFTIRRAASGAAMADTTLSVTISDTAVLSSLDADQYTVAAGDRVSISAVASAAPHTPTAAGAVYWRCDFIPDIDGETILLSSTTVSFDFGYFVPLIGNAGASDVGEFSMQVLFPTAGTIKKFFVELTVAPGVDTSRTFTIRQNGTAKSLAVTISGTNRTGSDVASAHDIDIAAGDKLAMLSSYSGAPAASKGGFGIVFLPDTQGEYIVSANAFNDRTSSTAVEYQHLTCSISLLTATESEQENLAAATTAKAIYVNLETAPGAGYSWVFTLREALGNTGLAVTISGTNKSGNTVADEAIASDALVDTSIDATAGTATSRSQIAYLFYNAPTGAAGWTQILYTSEPPTPNAWNQLKVDTGTGWKKLLFQGE